MSEKQEKRKRRLAKIEYECELRRWEHSRPHWWQFIKYRRWKKARPVLKS